MFQPETNIENLIGPLAWKIIGVLGGVIATMAVYIARLHVRHAAKVDKMYEARIADLRDGSSLVDTLLGVVQEKTKRGGGSP